MTSSRQTTIRPVHHLRTEVEELSDTLQDVAGMDWDAPTPAVGWSVRHQVAHLINVYELAMGAATGEEFRPFLEAVSADFQTNVANALQPLLGLDNKDLLERWEETSRETLEVFESTADDEVLPWLVNDIPAAVLCMAGTSEAFAHGQDIRDGLATSRKPGDQVRSICEFAFHTRSFGYEGRSLLTPVDLSMRFELTAPSGDRWQIGDATSANVITGGAWDLALLVTRRRHVDDLDLEGSTDQARDWMSIAQAYRGEPGLDRRPGQFSQLAAR